MGQHTDSTQQIALDDVSKEYGDVRAVDQLSLSVTDSSYHCLLGPNGSGKSTVLRLILGLTQPTAGELTVPDASLGCGLQRPNFYSGLSVRENIHVFADLVGATDWDWNKKVVKQLRLQRALDRRAGDLSGGFSRKLDLTLALIKKPDFLLLDEPLGALDDVTKELFLDFLDEYAQNNTILVATHHVTDFEPYVDRVTVMHRGTRVFDRMAEDIDLGSHDSLQSYYVETVLARERD